MLIDRLSDEELSGFRKHYLSDDNSILPAHIGCYLQWFIGADLYLTIALAYVLNISPWQNLDYVVRGLDSKTKCNRLKQATREKQRPLGPIFRGSINKFTKYCVPLRNDLVHSFPLYDKESGMIVFGRFGRMPELSADGNRIDTEELSSIHIDDLFSYTMWLIDFSRNIEIALKNAHGGGELEFPDGDVTGRLPVGVKLDK